MNIGRGFRAVARLTSNLVYQKTIKPPTGIVTRRVNIESINFYPKMICIANAPLPQPRLEIINPLAGILGEINTPSRYEYDVSLPVVNKSEMIEPPSGIVVEKKAAVLIGIRRRKMKKHKWRKLQKRMKYVYAKRRQKKELKKEKQFQAVLLAKIKEAEKFSAEDYIADRLKTAQWEKPITRVRGFFAPDWVIRDHLKAQEEEKRVKERIEYCLRMKK